MSDIAKGAIIGVVVAILMLGLLMEASGLWSGTAKPAEAGLRLAVDRIGPDGKPDSLFGDDLSGAEVPGSDAYAFCAITGMEVQRPPMFTSNMPDADCVLERGDNGKWLVSTGGWQTCQVSCFKLVGKEEK